MHAFQSSRRFFLLALGLLASCGTTAPLTTPAPLRVATDQTNPPFANVPVEGQPPVGFEVELARELARRLERPLVFARMDFDRILPTVESSEADLALATIGWTEERAARLGFTRPYYSTQILALVRTGEEEPRTVDDLRGLALSAGAGTTSQLAAVANGLGDDLVEAGAKDSPVVERLLSGALDAAIMDGPDALDFVAEYPGRLAVIEQALASERYSIGVRPDDVELLEQVDGLLDELEAEGWLAGRALEFGLDPALVARPQGE